MRSVFVGTTLASLALFVGPPLAKSQLKNTVYTSAPVVSAEPVTINRFGISPQKIVRPEGLFLLVVENRLFDHEEHISVTVDQDGAPELAGLDTHNATPRNAMLLDLKPGKYRLKFKKNTTNVLTIQINKQ